MLQPHEDNRFLLGRTPPTRGQQGRYCLGGRYPHCPRLRAVRDLRPASPGLEQARPVDTPVFGRMPPVWPRILRTGAYLSALVALVLGTIILLYQVQIGPTLLALARAFQTTPPLEVLEPYPTYTPQPPMPPLLVDPSLLPMLRPSPTPMAEATPAPVLVSDNDAPIVENPVAEEDWLPLMVLESAVQTVGDVGNLTPPARLAIPSLEIDTHVEEVGWHRVNRGGQIVTEWEVADFAASWHRTTAAPGQPGNMVISGHNNIRGAVFQDLYRIEPGSEVIVYAGDQPYRYRVDTRLIVAEKHAPVEQRIQNAAYIGPFPDERLTLISCWPPDSNTHRVIVIAQPVE